MCTGADLVSLKCRPALGSSSPHSPTFPESNRFYPRPRLLLASIQGEAPAVCPKSMQRADSHRSLTSDKMGSGKASLRKATEPGGAFLETLGLLVSWACEDGAARVPLGISGRSWGRNKGRSEGAGWPRAGLAWQGARGRGGGRGAAVRGTRTRLLTERPFNLSCVSFSAPKPGPPQGRAGLVLSESALQAGAQQRLPSPGGHGVLFGIDYECCHSSRPLLKGESSPWRRDGTRTTEAGWARPPRRCRPRQLDFQSGWQCALAAAAGAPAAAGGRHHWGPRR